MHVSCAGMRNTLPKRCHQASIAHLMPHRAAVKIFTTTASHQHLQSFSHQLYGWTHLSGVAARLALYAAADASSEGAVPRCFDGVAGEAEPLLPGCPVTGAAAAASESAAAGGGGGPVKAA